MSGHSLWDPPPGWQDVDPFPGVTSLVDPTVTAEELRAAVEGTPVVPLSWARLRFWALSHRQIDRPLLAAGASLRAVHFWRATVFLATDPIPRFGGGR